MPAFPLSRFMLPPLVAAAVSLLSIGAQAQMNHGAFKHRWVGPVPMDEISSGDIVHALIWTGHLGIGLNKSVANDVDKAKQAWLTSKKYKIADELTDEQTVELVKEGLKKRDSFGWAILRDKSIGFEVGIPTRLTTAGTPKYQLGGLVYPAEGEVSHHVVVNYGAPNCLDLDLHMRRIASDANVRVRLDDGFAYMSRTFETVTVGRATCSLNGMVTAVMSVPASKASKLEPMFVALAYGVRISGRFNPTLSPRPKVEEFPFASMGLPNDDPLYTPSQSSKEIAKRDPSGTTDGLRSEKKDGPDLQVDEIFEKVSPAIYVVKVRRGQGSAVAVGENTLLTNCHVVGDQNEVRLIREKEEMKAQVVSGKAEADRCVLKVDRKLPQWVGVRLYEDVKIGERTVAVGAPFGLELTATDGIVSAKRTMRGSKLVQTSTPVSPGSSGGGLFDARGNLIGITTFGMTVGQNLNFAVAAEEFMKESETAQAAPSSDQPTDSTQRQSAR